MKSHVWLCSAVCVGFFYLASLITILLKYKDIFKPDLEIPDLSRSVRTHQHDDVIRKSIKDHHFHATAESDGEDIVGPPLKYRDYESYFRRRGRVRSVSPGQLSSSALPHTSPTFHSSHSISSSGLSSAHSASSSSISPLPSSSALFRDQREKARVIDEVADFVPDQDTKEKIRETRSIGEGSSVKTAEQKLSENEIENVADGQNDVDEMDNDDHFHVEVIVGKWNLTVLMDGKKVLHEEMKASDVKYMRKGGLYLVVFHQSKGIVMHSSRHRTFEVSGDKDLLTTLTNVQPGRIVVLAAMCEAFGQLSDELEDYLRSQGSKIIADMTQGDRWAWVWTKNGRSWAEGSIFSFHPLSFYYQGGPLHLHAHPPRESATESQCSNWPTGEAWEARKLFCDLYEGYGSLCNCENPTVLPPPSPTTSVEVTRGIPTVIVASERPLCLYRCLSRLISVSGSQPETTLVVADGNPSKGLKEVEMLALLFGMKYQGHDSGGNNVTMRITRHYKRVFEDGFTTFPWADKIILLEEDLSVSSDFYSYFEQVAPILDKDPTLYCASAWNDLSTIKTASDPTVVLRSETMAGLGWILTKRLYQEIIPKWPSYDQFADWDMWMRLGEQRKGRECLVPEVPRTFHFGTIGAHLTAYFQSTYFSHTAFNEEPNVKLKGLDRLSPKSYDSLLREMILEGKHMDGSSVNPCKEDMISPGETSTHVMWIKMNEYADNYTISAVFNCLGLWDLDIRGGHKYLWRIRWLGTPLLIIGWPLSPFSELRPKDVNVLRRADPNVNTPDPPVFKILNANESEDYAF